MIQPGTKKWSLMFRLIKATSIGWTEQGAAAWHMVNSGRVVETGSTVHSFMEVCWYLLSIANNRNM